jgi:hypothetical protein
MVISKVGKQPGVDKPNGWFSSNDFYISGPICVSKTIDSRNGFAIKLESKLNDFGIIDVGYFTNSTCDPTNGDGGMPYSNIPDGINGFYKGSFANEDSAVIFVGFKKNGNLIGRYTFKIGASSNVFKPFSFPFDLSDSPDSVLIEVSASNVSGNNEPSAGTSIIFDDIQFTGIGITQQLNNANFDNWSTNNVYGFKNWSATTRDVTRTTDSYSGEAAAYIPVSDFGDGLFVGGNLILGEIPEIGKRQGIPYNVTNDTLSFYYKFNSVNEDSANVIISLFKQAFPIGGENVVLEPTTEYQLKKIPFNSPFSPDTLSLIFAVAQAQINPASLGSVLYIDDVKLNSAPFNALFEKAKQYDELINVFPNPAQNELYVELDGSQNIEYLVTDVAGKILISGVTSNKTTVDLSSLKNGIYLMSLQTNDGVWAVKRIVKSNQ